MYERIIQGVHAIFDNFHLQALDKEIRIVLNKEDMKSLVDFVNQGVLNKHIGEKSLTDFMEITAISIDGSECSIYRSINNSSYIVYGNMAVVDKLVTYGNRQYKNGTELKWQTIAKIPL